MKNPNCTWAVMSGRDVLSVRVPFGGEMVNLPLIVCARSNARMVQKWYKKRRPEVATTLVKLPNPFLATTVTGGAQ